MANALWVAPSLNGQWAPSSRTNESYYRKLITSRPSLAGFWRLDLPTGTTDFDQSTKGNTDTIAGGFTLNQPVVLVDQDWAVLFDGATGRASVPDNAAFHLGDVFTLSFWLKRSAVGLGATVGLIDAVAASSMNVQLGTDDKIIVLARAAGTVAKSSTAITDTTTWHHFAWTHDVGQVSTIYQDGVNVTTAPVGHAISNANGLVFAALNGPSNEFPGQMANVMLAGATFTAAQVAAEFRVGIGGAPIFGQQV
jgi:hypothetical protein